MSKLSMFICLTSLIFSQQGKAQWLEDVVYGKNQLKPPVEHFKCKTFKSYHDGQLHYINHYNKAGLLEKVENFIVRRNWSKRYSVTKYFYDQHGRLVAYKNRSREQKTVRNKRSNGKKGVYSIELGKWRKFSTAKYQYANHLVLTTKKHYGRRKGVNSMEFALDSVDALNIQNPIKHITMYGFGFGEAEVEGREVINNDTGWSFDAYYQMMERDTSYLDSFENLYGTVHHIYDTTLYSPRNFLQQEINRLCGGYVVVRTTLADSNHYNLEPRTRIALTPEHYLKWHKRNLGNWFPVDQEYWYVPDVELPCWFHNSQTGDSTLMLLIYEGKRTVRRNTNRAITECEYYEVDNGYYREKYTYLPHAVVAVSDFHSRFSKSNKPIKPYSEYRFADSINQFFLFANRKQIIQKRELGGEVVEVIFTINADSICCDTFDGYTLLFNDLQEIWYVGKRHTQIYKVTDTNILSYFVDYTKGQLRLDKLVDSCFKLNPKEQRGYESKPNNGFGGKPYPFAFWAKYPSYEQIRNGKHYERVPDSLLLNPINREALEWRIRMHLMSVSQLQFDQNDRLIKAYIDSDKQKLVFEIVYY